MTKEKCRVLCVLTLDMIWTRVEWGVSWKDLPKKELFEKGQGGFQEEGTFMGTSS